MCIVCFTLNWLVTLVLHDLHGCQLQVGKLSQRRGGDYVRTGNLCFAALSIRLVWVTLAACNRSSLPSDGCSSLQQVKVTPKRTIVTSFGSRLYDRFTQENPHKYFMISFSCVLTCFSHV